MPGPLQETRNLELVEDRVSVRVDDIETAERRIAEGDQPVNVVCPVESPAVRICHRNGPSELVLESHNDRHRNRVSSWVAPEPAIWASPESCRELAPGYDRPIPVRKTRWDRISP